MPDVRCPAGFINPRQSKDIAMSSLRAPSRLAISTAASLAFQFSPVTAASPQAPKPEIAITIFTDHYVLEDRVIDNLDVLEKAVSPAGARTIRLDACGAVADHAQRAAAHRFRAMSLELRLLEAHDSACRVIHATREIAVSAPRGQLPFRIDDEVVDQWWHASMP
jgi:hypothetical protein